VPQGSVLGPILFNIFINDLDSVVTVEQILKKFADDTKLGQVLEGPESVAALQSTLHKLCDWSAQWGMQFNIAKCHVMQMGRNNPCHGYQMNGQQLAVTKAERDVGVIISDNLKPSDQCKSAANTAGAVLGQILRAFHYRDRNVFVKMYVQYVRPHLEFAAPAWAPWSVADKACLEKVQERAVRAISSLTGRTYAEKLRELKSAQHGGPPH
jgi:hypothetical protein